MFHSIREDDGPVSPHGQYISAVESSVSEASFQSVILDELTQ
jgi:hypothetical protein